MFEGTTKNIYMQAKDTLFAKKIDIYLRKILIINY